MKIIRFNFKQNTEYRGWAREIRTKVFVVEQKVPEEIEYDEFDEIANHYLLMKGGKAIATARWRTTKSGIKLERFAMLKEYRNKGLGSILLDAILEDLKDFEGSIYLHAQLIARNYYSRKGFESFGEHFFEAGIEHVEMKLNRQFLNQQMI